MEKEKNIPVLRFPEFNGEWKEERLEKLFSEFKSGEGITSSNIYSEGVYPVYGGNGLRGYTDSYTHDGFHLLIGRQGALCGNINRSHGKAYISEHAIACKSNESSNTEWLAQRLDYFKLNKLSESSAQPGLSVGKLLRFKIFVPILPEQQKIAIFFTAIDQKISQLKKKRQFLEQYKKGVMQKIFSQHIRFKDDDGREFPKWEKKRLDMVISKFIVPMRDKPTDLMGEVPWCRIEDFDGKYLYKSKTHQGVSENTIKSMNLKVFPVNTLIVSCSANLGFCAIVKKELVTNQTFIGLVPLAHLVDVEFLFYTMVLSANRLNKLSSGTTISYLAREQFEKFSISIPSLPEQNKIANFLSGSDKKIKNIHKQIEQTEQWKKGLMQKMFV